MRIIDIKFKRDGQFYQKNMLLFVIDENKIRTLAGRKNIWWNCTSSDCPAREISEHFDSVGIVRNGFVEMGHDLIKNRVVPPGKSALVERGWTYIEDVMESLFVGTIFASGVRPLPPSL